jgi:hypothetical protein
MLRGRVTKVTSGEACEDWGELVYLFIPILFLIAFWILQLIYWHNFKLLWDMQAQSPGSVITNYM